MVYLAVLHQGVYHTSMSGKYVIDWQHRDDLMVVDSYIQWSDGRVYLCSTSRMQIEDNAWRRSIYSDGTSASFAWPSPTNTASTFCAVNDGKSFVTTARSGWPSMIA